MSLKTQQKLMIRLCLEKELRFLFSQLQTFRKLLSDSTEEPFFNTINLSSISYQADAIDVLLFNDLKANLVESFSYRDIKPIKEWYDEYRFSFPYRLTSKFQEYVRFLGFLLYGLADREMYFDLQQLIKADYSVALCSLKRERLIDEVDLLGKNNGKHAEEYVVNPTAISTRFTKSTKKEGRKTIYKVFFYKGNEPEISIAEINHKLHIFIKQNRTHRIAAPEARKRLNLHGTRDFSKESVVESGLLVSV